MNINKLFSEAQRKSIQDCIADAERLTSGEIRVHIDKACKGDVLDSATIQFHRLKMDTTRLRNGVLIYMAPADRKVAIIGDKGINEKVPEGFWDRALEVMKKEFHEEKYTEGLMAAIKMAGEQLQLYFPFHSGDADELNNDISYGE